MPYFSRIIFALLIIVGVEKEVWSQDPFTILDNYGLFSARGEAILEIDPSNLLTIGSGAFLIDSTTARWGIYIAEVNSISGESQHSDTLIIFNSFPSMGTHNTILRKENIASFIVSAGPELYNVKYDLENHEVSAIDTVHKKGLIAGYGPAQTTLIDDALYIGSTESSEDSAKYAMHIVKEDLVDTLVLNGLGKHLVAGPFEVFENDRFLITGTYDRSRLFIGEMNQYGELLEEYIFPESLNIFRPYRMIRLNDDELLLSAGEWVGDDKWPAVDGWRPVVIRVNYKTKEIVWKHYANTEFNDENSIAFHSLIPSESNNFLFAGVVTKGQIIRSVIGELDEDGNLIWQKFYSLEECELCRNNINDLEYLSSGNLVAYGSFSYHMIPADGKWLYSWLMKLDEEGEILPLEIVSTEDSEMYDESSIFSIYPNPVTNELYLRSETISSDYKIYNLYGEEVFHYETNSDFVNSIDVSMLSSGMYIIEMINDEKVLSSTTFVKI